MNNEVSFEGAVGLFSDYDEHWKCIMEYLDSCIDQRKQEIRLIIGSPMSNDVSHKIAALNGAMLALEDLRQDLNSAASL